MPVEDIAARSGIDLVAESVVQVLEDRLARTLAMIINTIDPDAIVLGGGLSNLERLYQNVHPKWRRLVFSKDIDTRLLKPKHGDSSGVRGAAWLWPDA
jgi:fructokinase